MRIIQCDRCHRQVKNEDELRHITFTRRRMDTGSTPTSIEVCEGCNEVIAKFASHPSLEEE